jgi:endonuclease III
MNLEQRTAFFAQLKANNPNPETELEYSSPFELLVAVFALGAGDRHIRE